MQVKSDHIDPKELLNLPAKKLLEAFGKGGHKPGSGSATAWQGMMSAELILTVIKLTIRLVGPRQDFAEIKTEIEDSLLKELEKLFILDAEQFDKVIEFRSQRKREKDELKKNKLAAEELKALAPATETPLKIGELCIKLGHHAVKVFGEGFADARGDSCVALENAIAAIAGCVAIADLNLQSFGVDKWTEQVRMKTDALRSNHRMLSTMATERRDVLKKEAERHKAFEMEVARFRSGVWEGAKLSYAEIEDIARDLQNMLWKYKDKIWKHKTPEILLDVLQPEVVLTKVLGYRFEIVDSLGQDELNGEIVDVAGMIEKEVKCVHISNQFEQETQDFTTGHELGHALLHKEVTAHRDRGLDGSPVRAPRPLSERQADKFSAYFLMPAKLVKRFFKERFGTEKFILDENTAFALNQGRVSELHIQWKEKEGDLGLALALATSEQYQGQPFYSLANVFRVSEKTMAIRLKELSLVEE